MKTFDDLLRAAFEAGGERRVHVDDWTHLNTGEYVGDDSVPDFETWRARLSGLDLTEVKA